MALPCLPLADSGGTSAGKRVLGPKLRDFRRCPTRLSVRPSTPACPRIYLLSMSPAGRSFRHTTAGFIPAVARGTPMGAVSGVPAP